MKLPWEPEQPKYRLATFSSMPDEDFIEQLRYDAIRRGEPSSVIDAIDSLLVLVGADRELLKVNDELEEKSQKLDSVTEKLTMARSVRKAKKS